MMDDSFERIFSPAMHEFIARLMAARIDQVGMEEMHDSLQEISFPIFKLCHQNPFGIVVMALAIAMDMLMNAGVETMGEDPLAEIEKELTEQEHTYEHYN